MHWKRILKEVYPPYAVVDLLLCIAVISELLARRFDLLAANLPLLLLAIAAFLRRLRREGL